MTAHDGDVIRAAGHRLKQIREQECGWNQRDVEKESRERWGEDCKIDQAVLSKIERGATAKPPNLKEAAQLAVLYDKPLSWIAEQYGLPVRYVEGQPDETLVARLAWVLRGFGAHDARRVQLEAWVQFAIEQALRQPENKGA